MRALAAHFVRGSGVGVVANYHSSRNMQLNDLDCCALSVRLLRFDLIAGHRLPCQRGLT